MELRGSMICVGDQSPCRPSSLRLSAWKPEDRFEAQPKVIVVDDERLLADTTADILCRAGFNTRIAYDAFEALKIMASFHPDYIITDIIMPAMNGVELAIAVAKTYPATKILLYSGQAGIADILEESRGKGFEFPLLAKPVHPSKLIEELKALSDT